MDNVKTILKRVCELVAVENNKELAEYLSVSYNTLNTWIKRNSIPIEKITQLVEEKEVSYDWLLKGIEDRKVLYINDIDDLTNVVFNETFKKAARNNQINEYRLMLIDFNYDENDDYDNYLKHLVLEDIKSKIEAEKIKLEKLQKKFKIKS